MRYCYGTSKWWPNVAILGLFCFVFVFVFNNNFVPCRHGCESTASTVHSNLKPFERLAPSVQNISSAVRKDDIVR